ncbi:hypothetical protein N801_03910 [Knoellia aerolata DSM 18566]|uniref:Uncharacterized protein n=1 Tax=Knoellia aerolata DSM 18566 TaxID=1385519 RepID=A0A0A0JYL7_9MICO|nr:hypothetical protein N801_03910 [Knoellia aerolata DSM 18566]
MEDTQQGAPRVDSVVAQCLSGGRDELGELGVVADVRGGGCSTVEGAEFSNDVLLLTMEWNQSCTEGATAQAFGS